MIDSTSFNSVEYVAEDMFFFLLSRDRHIPESLRHLTCPQEENKAGEKDGGSEEQQKKKADTKHQRVTEPTCKRRHSEDSHKEPRHP